MTGCNLGPAARESSMRCSSSAGRLWLVLLPTKQTKLHDEKRLMTDKGTVVSLFLFLAGLSRRSDLRAALPCVSPFALRLGLSTPASVSLKGSIASSVVTACALGFVCGPKSPRSGPESVALVLTLVSPPSGVRETSQEHSPSLTGSHKCLAGVSGSSTPQEPSRDLRARSRDARACEATSRTPYGPPSRRCGEEGGEGRSSPGLGPSRRIFGGGSPSARSFTTPPRAQSVSTRSDRRFLRYLGDTVYKI